jgi:catechol 2,3-dioxygenase-like lactoylglutathione lyase family enzyme
MVSGAPLPLGRFHELSLAASDIGASVEFYERLGFSQATTADTFTHPYGVLTDGRLFLGLHQRAATPPNLTFVHAGIAEYVPAYAALGIEFTVCRTGEEVFNEIGFADPFGNPVTILEARTYSPVARADTEVSLCGDFAEVSLPAADFAAAQAFWEPLGFVAMGESDTPYPHLTLTSDHLDLAFHRPDTSERPLIVFRAPDMPERIARLAGLGVTAARQLPRGVSASGNALIETPEGTALLLLAGEG